MIIMKAASRDNLIVLGILAVLVTVAVVLVYMPQGKKLKQFQSQIVSQKRVLSGELLKASVVPQMLRQVEQMKSRYRNFDRSLPKRKELAGFLKEISGHLADEKLSNKEIKPGDPTKEDFFHTLPIKMEFNGSYLSMANMLENINRMERLSRVNKLHIESLPDQEDLKIDLQLNIYFTES